MKTNTVKATVVKTGSATSLQKIQKESLQIEESSLQLDGIQEPPYNYDQLTDVYTFNGYHNKCINLKAIITAGLGYEIHGIDENQKEDEEYKKLKSFLDNHSSYAGQTIIETLINFQTDFEIFGMAYFELARNTKKELAEIYHIPGKEARIVYKDKEVTLAQVVNNERVFFSRFGEMKEGMNEFVMMKNYNPKSRFYGMPEYIGTLGSLILDRNATEYNINKFGNNAIPETIITLRGGSFGKGTKTQIKDFFTNNLKGIRNAGRSLILEAEDENAVIDVKPIAPEMKDASFRNLRLDARDEIIAAHGIPKMLLGIAEEGSLSDTSKGKSQLKIFQDCVIEPRQNRLEFLLNSLIIKQGLRINNWIIKLNKLYVDDPKGDAAFYESMSRIGALTNNEIREDLGYPPM
jgi:PBSX family phage portal protein